MIVSLFYSIWLDVIAEPVETVSTDPSFLIPAAVAAVVAVILTVIIIRVRK